MSDLRKAAQELLDSWDMPFNFHPAAHRFEKLRAALAQPEQEPYPLPESLYLDSKDWVASDYAGRVEWLHFMYESKKREVEQLETVQPERKPLTEEEICKLFGYDNQYGVVPGYAISFVRAVEKAHGIGGEHE
jgi:hypothetical protein